MSKGFYYDLLVSNGIIQDTNKSNYNIPCMFHGETNGASLSINFDKDVFKCFSPSCKGKVKGKLYKLLLDLKLIEPKGISDSNLKDFDFSIDRKVNEEKLQKVINLNGYQINIEEKPEYRFSAKGSDYLLSRGISKDVIEKNQCKTNQAFKRVIMPVFQDGFCYGYVKRSILSKKELDSIINMVVTMFDVEYDYAKKQIMQGTYDEDIEILQKYKPMIRYMNNKDFQKELFVFESLANDYDKSKNLCIVEGQINAMMVNTYGDNAIAIIGSYPTKVQIDYIMSLVEKHNLNLIPFFDNDNAGFNNYQKMSDMIGEFLPKPNWSYVDSSKNDICDLTLEEYEYLKNNLSFF